MDLSSITGNPIVKNLLFKQLKSAMKENNISLIAITLDEKGEPNFEVFNNPVSVVDEAELTTLKTLALGYE